MELRNQPRRGGREIGVWPAPGIISVAPLGLYANVLSSRPVDVDTSGKVWLYRPTRHKTAHFGHSRVVPIGPRGQAVLRPFLRRPLDAYSFSPAETREQHNAEKRARRKSKVQPSQVDRSKPTPQKPPGERYDTRAYYQAVQYAISAANRARREETRRRLGPRATKKQVREALAKVEIPRWHPHQLRHTAATLIRKQLGLDAARALLGQRSLAIADTYAELDQAVAIDAAKKLG